MAVLKGPRNLDKVKRDLAEAGYAGEKVTMLVATDYAQFKAIGDVAADMFQKIGMNVDYIATDWGTMLQRRNNRGPVDPGSCGGGRGIGRSPRAPLHTSRWISPSR
jgi:peptide/nickel transport system substrate-binding protein